MPTLQALLFTILQRNNQGLVFLDLKVLKWPSHDEWT